MSPLAVDPPRKPGSSNCVRTRLWGARCAVCHTEPRIVHIPATAAGVRCERCCPTCCVPHWKDAR